MVRAALMIVTALSLGGAPATAQNANSIAGRWTGRMGATGQQPMSIVMDLKVSGSAITGRVTGPELSHPGIIRKGAFDAATGVVTLEAFVEGATMVVNFDGKLANDSITGNVATNTNISGTFSIARAEVPQVIPPMSRVDTIGAAIKAGFTQVSDYITRAAQLVPPDRYTYKPVGTVRTFGQLLAHIVDGYAYYCGRGAGRNVQWSDAVEKGAVEKAALATKLKQASDACLASYGSPKQLPALLENIAHTNLHYGNIITYMRMMGLTPPSS
jgi:uncharacterized damage-inducible protein DinB